MTQGAAAAKGAASSLCHAKKSVLAFFAGLLAWASQPARLGPGLLDLQSESGTFPKHGLDFIGLHLDFKSVAQQGIVGTSWWRTCLHPQHWEMVRNAECLGIEVRPT